MNSVTQIPSDEKSFADRILVKAHDLFYRDGIRATGIDRIIAESGVSKKTFYRYYPSKNDLILKFLEYRHRNWMRWFEEALERHGRTDEAIVPALEEWFRSETYRGCAFINAAVELGTTFPEAVELSRRHKADMTEIIRRVLPHSPTTADDARALAIAVDGAIVGVQFGVPAAEVLMSLTWLVLSIGAMPEERLAAARALNRERAMSTLVDAHAT